MSSSELVGAFKFFLQKKEQLNGLNLFYGEIFKKQNAILINAVNVPLATGVKKISGVLTRNTIPAAIPYRIYRRSDGAMIKAGVSAADGTYTANGMPDVPCYLIALDPQDEFNAGVLDRLQPEA